ncbi:MAG: tetratricopeptide repeat protein [Candidatus Sericytochromatia bacterium]|nr:tetratricopeptide repeat protein [Candidatus Sericytochromatia bacterium]
MRLKPLSSLLLAVLAGLTTTLGVPEAAACSKTPISDEAFEAFVEDGYFRDRQGDYRGAIEHFQRAIAMRPTNRKVRYLLANTYWRDNQWTNARFAWETLLRMNPADKDGKEAVAWLRDYAREAWVPSVETLAGGGAGYVDGRGRAARFRNPNGMAVAASGNVYVTDTGNHRLRRVSPDGRVVTVAGSEQPGWADGPARSARLFAPVGGALDPAGNYFFADGARVRFLTPSGMVGTLAGDYQAGWGDGGPGVGRFVRPVAVAADWRGYVVVSDNGTAIRLVSPDGQVRTVAGGLEPGWADGVGQEARFRYVSAMRMLDKNNVLLVDSGNNRLRELNLVSGKVKTHPGCSKAGYLDGPLEVAHWRELSGVAVDSYGNMLVADGGNRAIRRISLGRDVQTIAGGNAKGPPRDGPGLMARFGEPSELAMHGNTLYILDRQHHAVRRIQLGRMFN